MEELEQQLQAFGNCAKVKRKTRKAGNPKTSSDQLESAIGALRERHRSLLRRFMLPPTVCMALGCEAPDLNRVLGCEAEAVSEQHLTITVVQQRFSLFCLPLPLTRRERVSRGLRNTFMIRLSSSLY